MFCSKHGDDWTASCVECHGVLCARQERLIAELREEIAKVWDMAITCATAACMVDIESEVPRSVYSRLNGPVRRRLLAENPFRDKDSHDS